MNLLLLATCPKTKSSFHTKTSGKAMAKGTPKQWLFLSRKYG